MKYDIIIVCFSQPALDARTLNFARTSKQIGLKVAIIGLQDDYAPNRLSGIDLYYVKVNTKKRMLYRWYQFMRKAGNIIKELNSHSVLAADLYSLPVISKAFAKRYIYDSREIYSAMGPLAGHKTKQKVFTEIEKYYSAILNVIYTSGEMDSEYLKKNLTDRPEYFEIYNVPPYNEPVKSNLIREKFNIESNSRIILYQGAILPHRGIIPVINYIKQYNDDVFCIIGYGEFEQTIRDLINSEDLNNRVFLAGKVMYDELHNWTCSADIGVSLFEPVSLSYELSFPNKLFEYIMAKIPVIATDNKPIRKVYQKYRFGALTGKEMTPEHIRQSLDYIEENKDIINKNLIAASGEYCYENQIDTIKRILGS